MATMGSKKSSMKLYIYIYIYIVAFDSLVAVVF